MQALVTIELPIKTFEELQAVARRQNRPIPDVVSHLVARESANLPKLPDEFEEELAAFVHLSNNVLWLLARSSLSVNEQEELERLNRKAQQANGLTKQEQTRQNELLTLYQRTLLRRTEAANLLRQRGQDMTNLLTLPPQ